MKPRIIIIIILVLAAVALPLKLAVDAANAKDQTVVQDWTSQDPASAEPQTVEGRVFINNLGPNEYTPENYVAPKYDPFNNRYNPSHDYKDVYPPLIQPNTLPEPSFTIKASKKGFADNNVGTVGTTFIFSASGSTDSETANSRLQVRWYFEDSETPDTYFSAVKSVKHIFEKAGVYDVTLEVLDRNGGTSRLTKQVTVVNNTAPTAYLIAKQSTGLAGTVFEFDTGKSSDSQYLRAYLQYRFDWNGDGIYDTTYKSKTVWKHKFEKTGSYHVVMETKDPSGATATYYRDITVTENTPPKAAFSIAKKSNTYTFDASSSTDKESPKKLQYRWDFNYTGADDIVFDTRFSTSPKHTGSYTITGKKRIRLQVKDSMGLTDEAYAEILFE
jgi:hypothetical protein